ncbi:MAG: DNA (cytosine-5-)-methyltransferase [Kiritimatiellae bacterium]|nr:DNA (cytosine-5-)-methyltransferase [Kiritimatiellia bacterium]
MTEKNGQKAVSRKRKEIVASDSESQRFVLVGTYKKEPDQLKWIGKRHLYNYPLSAEEAQQPNAGWSKVKELWLYSGPKDKRHIYAAEFVGIKPRKEFLAEYPDYPKGSGKGHGDFYAVFAVKSKYQPTVDDAVAVVRVRDFAKRTPKIAKAIEAHQNGEALGCLLDCLPSDLAPLPHGQLRVCEAAVQLDFFHILDDAGKILAELKHRKAGDTTLRFIDLFAGIGGVRKGFELACVDKGIKTKCVFTSEIKPHAIEILKQNHPDEYIHGDITKIDENEIPDFDVLLGGFPCQAFSAAGKRLGFEDTRGTLFFDVARILKAKKPLGFVLENVEGLVNHDRRNANDPYGHTLAVILATLEELGYKVSWRVLNASDFGVPQDRRRIYIVCAKKQPNLDSFAKKKTTIASVLEQGLETAKSKFIDKLLSHYRVDELLGKAIKDKRGGTNNIHSWDIELKGKVSQKQRKLLNALLKERRKHQWADIYKIDWMDGMPLTLEMIRTFFDDPKLEELLEDLVSKRYVVKEHPKRKVKKGRIYVREQDLNLPLGYNIVAGKMSFEISKIMSPHEIAPTLVAMDMQHLYVADGDGLRTLSLKEGLGMFGYPSDFKFNISKDLGYDLLGNTVVVPVIKAVSSRLLEVLHNGN